MDGWYIDELTYSKFKQVTIANMTPDELARYYPDPVRDAAVEAEYERGYADGMDMGEDLDNAFHAEEIVQAEQSAREEIIAITLATLNL